MRYRRVRLARDVAEGGRVPDPLCGFLGESPAFSDVVERIERAAAADSAVLFSGETGSGKEMAARRLHDRSRRRHRPFIVVDCAALHEGLIQSELFGHERGAFTGADRPKPGLFEVADGGTIFLDEIGDISPSTQMQLLRVLDSSTFRHVGGTREIQVDVRIISATIRDLPSLVRQGLFRKDLFYRLSTVTISLPPLRERAGDVELLAQEFTTGLNSRNGTSKWVAAGAARLLREHDWPGNVRELLHVIEAAMVADDGQEIRREHVAAAIRTSADPPVAAVEAPGAFPSLRDVERAHVARALRVASGHRARAAALLRISERTLYRKLLAYGAPRTAAPTLLAYHDRYFEEATESGREFHLSSRSTSDLE